MLDTLRTDAIDRHRARLFGTSSLKVYSTTPSVGETLDATIATGWRARRIRGITDGAATDGAWQFEIVAPSNWNLSQAYMRRATVLVVDDLKWRVTKVERPVGVSLVWKLRAKLLP